MKNLSWGVYLIVFCLPLYLVRFRVFNIPTTVLELMIYAFFLIWLIKGFSLKQFKEIFKKNRLLFLTIFLILLGVSLATARSWNLRLSAGIWKAWFVDPILFFIVFISVIDSLDKIEKVFYSFVFSGFIVSVVSLVYFFIGISNSEGRLQGFYNSPNYLAMYLAPALIIVLGYYFFTFFVRSSEANSGLSPSLLRQKSETMPAFGLKTRSKIIPQKIRLLVCCFLLVIVIYLTRSFGAWIGILGAIGLGLAIWFWNTKREKLTIGIAVLLLVLCIGIYFIKFNSIQGKLSIHSRTEIWQETIKVIQIYPVFGIGPGTFEDFFPAYPVWGVPQPHNIYLAFLLQTGIIGFIGFVLLLYWFFRTAFNISKTQNQEINFHVLLVLSVVIYVLIHGLVDTTYWKNDLSVEFWIIIGLMTVLKKFYYLDTGK